MQYLGPWQINAENFSITDQYNSYELEPLLFNLLCYFLAKPNRIISRQELAEQVWQQSYVDDNAINRAISDLRKALQHPQLGVSPLKTHHRKGYSLLWGEQQQQEFMQTPPPIRPPSLTTPKPADATLLNDANDSGVAPAVTSPSSSINRRLAYALLLLLALTALTWWLIKPNTPASVTAAETETTVTPVVKIEQKLTWQKGIEYNVALSNDRQLLAYNHTFNARTTALKVRPNPILAKATQVEVSIAREGYSYILLGWQQQQSQLLVYLKKDDASYCVYQLYDFANFPAYQARNLELECEPSSRTAGALTADGTKLYRLTNRPGSTAESIVLEHLNTGQTELIVKPRGSAAGSGIVSFALSPDGNQLAYLHNTDRLSGAIYLYNLESSEQEVLANFTDTGLLLVINWDNEGRYLYGANGAQLVQIDVATKQLKKVALPAGYTIGELVPIGEQQAIASDFGMLKVNTPGSWQMQIVDHLFEPTASRFTEFSQDTGSIGVVQVHPLDPEQLVYSANKGNGWQLWLRHHQQDRQLTAIPESKVAINNVDWSPDGTQLVMAQHGKLWLYDVVEQQLRELAPTRDFNFPVFEPSGKSIIVQRQQGNQSHLWRMDIATGELQQLSQKQAIQPHFDQGTLYYTHSDALYQFVDGAKQDQVLTETDAYTTHRVFLGWVYQLNQRISSFSRYPLTDPTQQQHIQQPALSQSGLPMSFSLNPHQPEQMFILRILYPEADLYHISW